MGISSQMENMWPVPARGGNSPAHNAAWGMSEGISSWSLQDAFEAVQSRAWRSVGVSEPLQKASASRTGVAALRAAEVALVRELISGGESRVTWGQD